MHIVFNGEKPLSGELPVQPAQPGRWQRPPQPARRAAEGPVRPVNLMVTSQNTVSWELWAKYAAVKCSGWVLI